MATPSYDNSSLIFPDPVPVIGTEFCSPRPIDLVMVKSALILTDTKFVVTDSNGNLLLKVNKIPLSFRSTHLILDSTGKTLLTLRRQIFSVYQKWEAFRGDSSDIKDLVFSARKSSLFQVNTNLDIFLTTSGNNESEEKFCDYKLKGGWLSTSFTVYASASGGGGGGDSTSIVAAQMETNVGFMDLFLWKKKFEVNVQQNVDYAFVVALTTIFEDIISRKRRTFQID